MTMTKLKKLYHVWRSHYPDDEALESSTLVEADDARQAVEECCWLKFSDWDYPAAIECKVVIEGGRVEDAEVYEVTVHTVPEFEARRKKGAVAHAD